VRFLLDEGLPFRLATDLRSNGYDGAICGRDHPQSLDDRDILAIAVAERRIVLTNDKDFGDLVFRDGLPHAGVILFRLGYVPIDVRVALLRRVLSEYPERLNQFIVVSHQGVRIGSA
jgi:predicted nuclease of predicted toxin-antitoxin system